MRAGSSGLGRLGLGLVALCLVKAVDQRLDDELDRQLVDVLHVLRISVLQRTLDRVQKRFLDFLQAQRILVIIAIYEIKIDRKLLKKKKKRVILVFWYIQVGNIIPQTFNRD